MANFLMYPPIIDDIGGCVRFGGPFGDTPFQREYIMAKDKPYDANENPHTGPWAGVDPAQQPVIVNQDGTRADEQAFATNVDAAWSDAREVYLMNALAQLCETQNVQIETSPSKPVHRLVIGGGDFRTSLAEALTAALAHHAKAE